MIKSTCIRYFIVFIITHVAIGIISFILQNYFQIDLGSGGPILSIMVPALDAGMNYYNKTGEAPSISLRWKFARYFTLIQFVFATLLLVLLWNFIPELPELGSSVGITIIALVMIVYMLITLLASRVFFGMGIKTAEKAAKRIGS